MGDRVAKWGHNFLAPFGCEHIMGIATHPSIQAQVWPPTSFDIMYNAFSLDFWKMQLGLVGCKRGNPGEGGKWNWRGRSFRCSLFSRVEVRKTGSCWPPSFPFLWKDCKKKKIDVSGQEDDVTSRKQSPKKERRGKRVFFTKSSQHQPNQQRPP